MPGPLLLIFAQSAQAEAGRKKFVGNYNSRRRVFQRLNDHVKAVGRSTDLTVIICDENSQQGKSFGEKLANALDAAFNNGHEEVVVIGNDCPALSGRHIAEAVEALRSAPFVIGPDYRGGAYLIGIQKSAFHKKSFELLRWQSAALTDDLSAYSEGCVSLSYLHDINSGEDILFAAREMNGANWLRRFLLELLAVKRPAGFALSRRISVLERDAWLLRGPPVLA